MIDPPVLGRDSRHSRYCDCSLPKVVEIDARFELVPLGV
jgi:hypothetical protein